MNRMRWGLIGACLLLAGCSSATDTNETRKQLVGTWRRGADPWETYTFTSDGKYSFSSMGDGGPRSRFAEDGTYTLLDPNTIEIKATSAGYRGHADREEVDPAPARRRKITIAGDKLTFDQENRPWRREDRSQ
jgi:hypothetical protein